MMAFARSWESFDISSRTLADSMRLSRWEELEQRPTKASRSNHGWIREAPHHVLKWDSSARYLPSSAAEGRFFAQLSLGVDRLNQRRRRSRKASGATITDETSNRSDRRGVVTDHAGAVQEEGAHDDSPSSPFDRPVEPDEEALLDDRVGTRRVEIDPALLALTRRPKRALKEDEQTVDELEIDPDLLEKSRKSYSAFDEEETLVVSAHPGFQYIEEGDDAGSDAQEGQIVLEDAGLGEARTKLERPAQSFGEEKTQLAPLGYGSDDEATVHAHPGYESDNKVEALRRRLRSVGSEATALAQQGHEANVEAEDPGQPQYSFDLEATDPGPADSEPPNPLAADAAEASRRVSRELEVQFHSMVSEDDTTTESAPPAGIIHGSNDSRGTSAAPVIQVSVKQVGSNVEGAPRELPKRPVDESRQATIALGYEVPESMREVVPLTRVKETPNVQEEPLQYMETGSQKSQQAAKPQKRRRRRRVSPALVIACILFGICVSAGAVLAFFAFAGDDYGSDSPPATPNGASPNEETKRVKAHLGARPNPPPPVAARDAGGSVSEETGASIDGSQPHPSGEGETSSLSELPDESVLPITFEDGEFENVEVDETALERIVAVMLAQPTLRFEIIGYASLEECDTVEEAQFVSARRARKAVRIIRQHGPTGKRFVTRGARPDDTAPAGAKGRVTVLRVLNR